MIIVFEGYTITSPFGWIRSPFNRSSKEFHTGIDLVKKHKAPIEAFTEGTILFAGEGKAGTGLGGYGNVVVVKDKHDHGQVYAHLDRVAVKTGEKIKQGQIIGYQGATGQVTGSHLHYEIRKGTTPSYGWSANYENYLNPTDYLEWYDSKKISNSKLQSPVLVKGDSFSIHQDTPGYSTAADAKLGINKKTTVKAGTYFIYSNANGMINVTKKKGTPGSWINLNTTVVIQVNSQKQYISLPSNANAWRVYPLNKDPVKGNEIGSLNPQKFGGLTYEIIGNPRTDVYTIRTSDYGTVNIYAAPSTGAIIK